MQKTLNLIFIFLSFCSFSQKNKTLQTTFNVLVHEKIYSISFPNIPVRIEIVKHLNDSISGALITSLEKNTKEVDPDNFDDINKFEETYDKYNFLVYDRCKLDNTMCNAIYNILNGKLEKLEPCNNPFDTDAFNDPNYVEDCNSYLHGPSSEFTFLSRELEKRLSIPILGIDIKYDKILELPKKQKDAQELISLINKKINIMPEFRKAQKRIVNKDLRYPYSYFTRGYITVTLNSKKK